MNSTGDEPMTYSKRVAAAIITMSLVSLAAPSFAGPGPVADPLAPLRALEGGEWHAADGTVASYVEYAKGTVVLEKLVMGGQKESMVTMYSVDGGDVVLTHYCNRNHASRMASRATSEVSRATSAVPGATSDVHDVQVLRFELIGGTNLPVVGGGYMSGLELRFVDHDHFRAVWSIRAAAKDRADARLTFDFTRAPAGNPAPTSR
jgi:hypothetical protein